MIAELAVRLGLGPLAGIGFYCLGVSVLALAAIGALSWFTRDRN